MPNKIYIPNGKKIKGDQKMETKQIQKEGLGIDALIEEAEE